MNLVKSIENVVSDSLQSFKALQIIIALVCILIPIIFWLSDKDIYYPEYINTSIKKISYAKTNEPNYLSNHDYKCGVHGFMDQNCGTDTLTNAYLKICKDKAGFRSSLSDYAHSSNSYIFGLMYAIAAMMYVYNGVVYLKQNNALQIHKNESLVHLFIGLSLIGVVLHPLYIGNCLHILFSVLFFLGNICLMLFFKKEKETSVRKSSRIVMGIMTLLTFLGPLPIFDWYSVMWAESISMLIIASYLIMISYYTEQR